MNIIRFIDNKIIDNENEKNTQYLQGLASQAENLSQRVVNETDRDKLVQLRVEAVDLYNSWFTFYKNHEGEPCLVNKDGIFTTAARRCVELIAHPSGF